MREVSPCPSPVSRAGAGDLRLDPGGGKKNGGLPAWAPRSAVSGERPRWHWSALEPRAESLLVRWGQGTRAEGGEEEGGQKRKG